MPISFASRAIRSASAALLALLLTAGSASAATDHVVITGGAIVAPGQTAGDVIVVDGPVTIAGPATGDVVSVSGPIRLAGRIDGDLIAVSDRALLGPRARVGGDLRYGDERPVLAPGARVVGTISNENWADLVSCATPPWTAPSRPAVPACDCAGAGAPRSHLTLRIGRRVTRVTGTVAGRRVSLRVPRA
jgi:hypothetical protein